ncbi:MAG: phytanoyl-CoA dioxygenase family protein [Mycobacteriales bacterium]
MTATVTHTRFDTDGFVVFPRVAAGPALERLHAAVGRLEQRAADLTRSTGDFVLEATGAGGWVAWQQGDEGLRGVLRSVSNADQYEPELRQVAADIGLADWVAAVLDGPAPALTTAFLWAKPARVGSAKPWHQDMAMAPPGFADQHPNIVTVWLALDQATPENGCLEFVPGSHRLGVLPHLGDAERPHPGAQPADRVVEPYIDLATVLPTARRVAMPLEPGSAVAFDGWVVHRSATNTASTPRRAVSYVFALGGESGLS